MGGSQPEIIHIIGLFLTRDIAFGAIAHSQPDEDDMSETLHDSKSDDAAPAE